MGIALSMLSSTIGSHRETHSPPDSDDDPPRLSDQTDSPATLPPSAPLPAPTSSSPSLEQKSTPTVATSLEGRAAFTANSGAAYRAFQLNRRFDELVASPSPLPTDPVELSPEQQAVQDIYRRWSDPATLESELDQRGRNLNGFTDAELQTLAALSIDHPQLEDTIADATFNTVREAESLEDIPSSVGFQYLLEKYALQPDETGEETDPDKTNAEVDYGLMVRDEVRSLLGDNLEGARGDDGLESAVEDFTDDLEDFLAQQPAAASLIEGDVRDEFEERAEQIQDIQRADDPWYSDVGHFISDTASSLADAIFPPAPSANTRHYGPFADFFNSPAVREARNFSAGFSYAGHQAIESLGQLVADPIGSARAFVDVVKNPRLLLAGYREAAELYGPSGGAGAIGFDFLTASVGASAIPSSFGSAALRALIRGIPGFPDLPSSTASGRLIDDATGLIESRRFTDLPTELQDDILDAIGRNPADVDGRRGIINLVDSDAFGELDATEQARLVRYVGGENPYVSAPARAQLDELLQDPNFGALSPTEQAERLRRFTSAESPYYIIEPPPGTHRPDVDATIGEGVATRVDFASGTNVPAHRYDVSIDGRSVEVVVPDRLARRAGHQHTLDEVVTALRSMPEANRAGVDRIILEPGPDPSNGTYASGANSYMTAGRDGSVRIYPTKKEASFEALASTLVHETGHVLTHREWGSPSRVPNGDGTHRFEFDSPQWNRYHEAVEADGVLPSGYAAVDIGEDAAETMRLYSMVRGTPYEAEIRALYPHRFELLDELIGGG